MDQRLKSIAPIDQRRILRFFGEQQEVLAQEPYGEWQGKREIDDNERGVGVELTEPVDDCVIGDGDGHGRQQSATEQEVERQAFSSKPNAGKRVGSQRPQQQVDERDTQGDNDAVLQSLRDLAGLLRNPAPNRSADRKAPRDFAREDVVVVIEAWIYRQYMTRPAQKFVLSLQAGVHHP